MLFGKRKDTMNVTEAQAALEAGRMMLVDVREDAERAHGFAPGSLHVPLGELEQRLGELPTDQPVAFICGSGQRSAKAATVATRAGLAAHNVSGGMAAWKRQGLDTTTPRSAR